MPRKRLFRRVRRVRLALRVGLGAVALGLGLVSAAAPDVVLHGEAGGWLLLLTGLVLVAVGAGGAARVGRAGSEALARDRRDLVAADQEDGLPMGAFVQDGRLGLEAADRWWTWGTVAVGLGLMIGGAAAAAPDSDWWWGPVFSSVGLVPAVLCLRAATGTKYWLTPEGIETARWPRRSVRWADVERVVPLRGGVPEHPPDDFNALELQTSGSVRGAPRRWGSDLVLRLALVEADRDEVLGMVHERVRAARELS
ncbi:hypothetical protein [Nocardioides sp. 503]|uniref:hypothetical protein n=1 Tax=Nocardioides sp. 503 TaxID=2508326 RepID=UPI0010701AA9|nr:hypothetical protein [Nocardioides sp. 503]